MARATFTMASKGLHAGDPLVNKTMWILIDHLVLNLNIPFFLSSPLFIQDKLYITLLKLNKT